MDTETEPRRHNPEATMIVVTPVMGFSVVVTRIVRAVPIAVNRWMHNRRMPREGNHCPGITMRRSAVARPTAVTGTAARTDAARTMAMANGRHFGPVIRMIHRLLQQGTDVRLGLETSQSKLCGMAVGSPSRHGEPNTKCYCGQQREDPHVFLLSREDLRLRETCHAEGILLHVACQRNTRAAQTTTKQQLKKTNQETWRVPRLARVAIMTHAKS